MARYVRNQRLADALHQQAFCALRASPGARGYYDSQRARGSGHHAALRQLSNRLAGILHGCLKTRTFMTKRPPGPTTTLKINRLLLDIRGHGMSDRTDPAAFNARARSVPARQPNRAAILRQLLRHRDPHRHLLHQRDRIPRRPLPARDGLGATKLLLHQRRIPVCRAVRWRVTGTATVKRSLATY